MGQSSIKKEHLELIRKMFHDKDWIRLTDYNYPRMAHL
jgi:hypothetical protein